MVVGWATGQYPVMFMRANGDVGCAFSQHPCRYHDKRAVRGEKAHPRASVTDGGVATLGEGCQRGSVAYQICAAAADSAVLLRVASRDDRRGGIE